jgi:hypothetical protein
MLSVTYKPFVPSVIMLSVVMPNVIMLSVVVSFGLPPRLDSLLAWQKTAIYTLSYLTQTLK